MHDLSYTDEQLIFLYIVWQRSSSAFIFTIIISCCSLLGCWKQMQEQKQNHPILLFLQYLSLPPVQENTWDFTLWFTYRSVCMKTLNLPKIIKKAVCVNKTGTHFFGSVKSWQHKKHIVCAFSYRFLNITPKIYVIQKYLTPPHPLSPCGNCHVYRHFPFIPLLNPDPVPWTRMKMVPEWWIITF